MVGSPEETKERIIGYDARENWLPIEEGWSDHRKQGFLYRLDVLKPLSADTRVWPTIFESEGRQAPIGQIGFQSCWADFYALQSAVAKAYEEKLMRPWRMIAVTLVLGPYCENSNVPWTSRLPQVNPDQRTADWIFLGYDVCDQWLLSALSNCGFLPGLDDVPKLRTTYGPLLNKFHLFRELGDAILFKRFSDERLRDDHAPCFVFGLWMVK